MAATQHSSDSPVCNLPVHSTFQHEVNIFGYDFENVRDRYVLGQELGRGTFGIIRLCVERETGAIFACKSVTKSSLLTPLDRGNLRREVLIMDMLEGHSSIISLHAVMEDKKRCHLIMELAQGGELFERIHDRGRYPEADAAKVTLSLVSVLAHCQRFGVVHRDLKPENILLQHADCHTSIKVVDFGLAEFVEPGECLTSMVGTPYYCAPEVLRRESSHECDMWSVGVILYCMLCGQPPFWHDTDEGILEAVESGYYDIKSGPWRKISDGAKNLVSRFLVQNPRKRITPAQVAQHPWILKHCQNADVSNLGTRESDKYSLDDSSDLDSFRHLAYHSESDVGSTLGSSYSLSSTVESQG